MIVYVIQKIWCNDNSPDSLNVMVNYHYHSENRLITSVGPAEVLAKLQILYLIKK